MLSAQLFCSVLSYATCIGPISIGNICTYCLVFMVVILYVLYLVQLCVRTHIPLVQDSERSSDSVVNGWPTVSRDVVGQIAWLHNLKRVLCFHAMLYMCE